ncbi:MAG TPA: acyltransferase [Thermoanaerobaculia bacterium]|nr:acyltransferase [Thermoanaerobaculia bacterium]
MRAGVGAAAGRPTAPTRLQADKQQHIGSLDGLRAAAIGLVLLYHLTPGHDSNRGLRALPFKIADLGWTGVDLFFVLSGFLITSKLIAARDDEHRFRDFYKRRALRVFPLYYAALAVALLIVPFGHIPPLRAQLSFWLYYANFVQVPMAIELNVGHFWSLAIEEQFYLVWPAVIFLTRERTARRVCIAIVLLALISRCLLVANGSSWLATFAWTPCRADGLAIGSLLALTNVRVRTAIVALVVTTPILAWVAWTGAAPYVFLPDGPFALRAFFPAAVAIFFGALLVIALEVPAVSRALSGRFFSAIARWSYGMYVFHYLLNPLWAYLFPPARLSSSPNVAAALYFLITSTLSTILAAASYRGFESYFLRRR